MNVRNIVINLSSFNSQTCRLLCYSLITIFLFSGACILRAQTDEPSSENLSFWKDAAHLPQLTLLELKNNPEKYNNKRFLFYGIVGSADFKTFGATFVEKEEKPKDLAEDIWNKYKLGFRGGNIDVYFASWYKRASTFSEGKKKVRVIADTGAFTDDPDLTKFAFVCTVREFTNTFQPFLELEDMTTTALLDSLKEKTSTSPKPTAPVTQPRKLSDPVLIVCPQGQLGEFAFGTKCTGFYHKGEDGKTQLLDIEAAGKSTNAKYDSTKSLIHAGLDIVAKEGSDIFPILDGKICDIISSPSDANFNSLGYMVMVKHNQTISGKPTFSLYLHMNEKPSVQIGQEILRGKTALGKVGHTGAAMGDHVHIEVRHFESRFFPKWHNIYGIEEPKEEATFSEIDLKENWEDPKSIMNQSSGNGLSQNPRFSPLVADASDSEKFQEGSLTLQSGYDAVWDAVLQVLKARKENLLKTDKESGIIFTDVTQHGLVMVKFNRYAILVEKLNGLSTKITYKIFRYTTESEENGEKIYGNVGENSDYDRRQDEGFEKEILKKLGLKKVP